MRTSFIILVFLARNAFGQFNYVIDQSIPVALENGNALSKPWAGGLNATHFNTIDLNNDGLEDLAIFDRTANRIITFIQDNNQYQYAPEYEILFPADIASWMLLRDYNGDGKKDIFTDNNGDIKVYTNVTASGALLQWKHFLFFTGAATKSHVLVSLSPSMIKVNVHMNLNDLPAISDADGDGDLDLFVPKFASGSTITFYKNYSVELYGTQDSLAFKHTLQPWGGITECDCGEFAFNNEPCEEGGRVKHAGGKSLFVFDADNDGDHDMLFSEEGHADEGGCSQIFLLPNEGDNTTPVITSASAYPPASPATIVSYPAAFYEDVDFDGVKDLILSPNIHSRQFLQTNFKQSVWFYKNTGTTSQPTFSTPNTSFLQQSMIDVGDNAVPAFFDADGDADLDLFVGCYTQDFSGSIYYFENTGTQTMPSFKLITSNYLGLSSLNLTNIKPAFADMNSDGKIDLVLTASNLWGFNTQLYYLPNNNSIGTNFSQTLIAIGFTISPTDNVSIIDVDFDGKKDLLVGKSGTHHTGNLQYWKNTSVTSTPSYVLEDEGYLGFGSSIIRSSPSCTAADLDGDGKTDLLIGDHTGTLTVISNFRNATDTSANITNIIYNHLQEAYVLQNLGGHIWPTIANIFKTDRPTVVVGNSLGGIHIIKPDESIPVTKTPIIDIYPNPIAKGSTLLTIKVDRPAAMIAITSLGQEIGSTIYLQALEEYNFQLREVPKGVYLLYFVIDGKSQTRRIVVY